jgi:fructan beta-fructosidase
MLVYPYSLAGLDIRKRQILKGQSLFWRELLIPDEPFRPQYHFTPPQMWANDPNGLVYSRGEYHLFYQHHPYSMVWGPMHWGHAVSRDLVNWEHLPIALYPDDNGAIFSGSAVIDWQNTAGFGKEAMVAIFTHDLGGQESQSLAYSTDQGHTWTKYVGNPVLLAPIDLHDFRDPKVFWYGKPGNGHWVMALAAGNTILFYISANLKDWTASGSFGFGYGATQGFWETPDLFELPLDNGLSTRWILTTGVHEGAPAGGTGTQYFVGAFDGETFTSENPEETVLWVDYGADFYAAQTWNNEPNGRRIVLAWQSNGRYANLIPTCPWRGAFSLPRELSLTTTSEGVRLIQQPVGKLRSLRSAGQHWEKLTISSGTNLLANVRGETLEINAEFQANTNADRLGFRVRTGAGEYTAIGFAPKQRKLFFDRSHSGQTSYYDGFANTQVADLVPDQGMIRMHIFVDSASVEVFAQDGRVVFSNCIFPSGQSQGLELFVDGGTVTLNSLGIYQLNPARFIISS